MKRKSRSSDVVETARQNRFTGWLSADDCYVNLAGEYDYLEYPYYVSQDYEGEGKSILPTCEDMLDAYVPPLFLEKAKAAGIAVPEFFISNGYFEPPVIVDPINPFTLKGRIVLKPGRAKSIAKSTTRNFTYAICCQELPPGSRISYFRSVLGWCGQEVFRDLSWKVWEVFHIPVARVRVVITADGQLLLSDIAPLPFGELGSRELRYIRERVVWDS
ncbi:MAG: RimK-like ATPgrasp N-terminal domain-containing protein [candidate division Zixibacteria bacterium]|nr:RimK-like ATPgrasp N-terminal domain-containing protein [candidate division Zixibacteria bacterium]